MTRPELNILMNSWEEGTRGHVDDKEAVWVLDALGKQMGYGALAQFAQWLYEIQCNGNPKNAADLKRERFGLLGWKLPRGFEEVAAKEAAP